MAQEEIILEHLRKHKEGITSWESFKFYGITRLSAKIFNLRERGFEIGDNWEEAENRFGENVRFKRYFLIKERKI